MRWDEVESDRFDGLILPGGHRARGMRAYLESPLGSGPIKEIHKAMVV
jgi:hypothetical protein